MKPQLANFMQSIGRQPSATPAAPVDPSQAIQKLGPIPDKTGGPPLLNGLFGNAVNAFGTAKPMNPMQAPTAIAAQPFVGGPNQGKKPGGMNPFSANLRKTGLNPATSNTVSTQIRPTSEVKTEPPKLKFSRPMGSATLYGGRRM